MRTVLSWGKPEPGILLLNNGFSCHLQDIKNPSDVKGTKSFHSQWRDTNWPVAALVTRKIFPCNVCGKVSQSKRDMEKHMRTHTGERPYKCPTCTYATGDQSTLRRHQKKYCHFGSHGPHA